MAEKKISNLSFELFCETKSKKTKIYLILNHSNEVIGRVYWFSKWRQYVSETYSDIVMSSDCLQEVCDFLKDINKKHKEMRNNGK